jgi:hypothetical protein
MGRSELPNGRPLPWTPGGAELMAELGFRIELSFPDLLPVESADSPDSPDSSD